MNTEEFSSRNLGAIVHEVDRAFAEEDGRTDKGNGKEKAGLAQHAGEVFTDLANARRLVARHGHNLRYCFPQGSWYVWDGKHWVRETTGEVMRLAKETAISIYQEAASALTEQQRKVLSGWARRSESEARLKAMVSLARSEPSIPVRSEELDAQPWLSNAQNGTINLRSGDLQEHRREDLITKQVPVAYDPDAECPRWDDFLVEITGGNLRKAAYLQRIFGYALTGSTREQCWFFSWGAGDNGKTVLHQIMRECLGDYAQAAEFSSFITNRNDKIRTICLGELGS